MWKHLTIAVKVLVSLFLSAIFFKSALHYSTLTSYYDMKNLELFLAIWGALSLGVILYGKNDYIIANLENIDIYA